MAMLYKTSTWSFKEDGSIRLDFPICLGCGALVSNIDIHGEHHKRLETNASEKAQDPTNVVAYDETLVAFLVQRLWEGLDILPPSTGEDMGQVAGLDSILRSTLAKIDAQIHEIQNECVRRNALSPDDVQINEYQLRDAQGNYVIVPLLQARAQVLLAIAMNK